MKVESFELTRQEMIRLCAEIGLSIPDPEMAEKFALIAAVFRDLGYRHPELFPIRVKYIRAPLNQ